MQIKKRKKKKTTIKRRAIALFDFISTGCLLLDLALSNKGKGGGIARGRIINIVGDGGTGKTLLALEIAAWFFYMIKKVKSKIFRQVKRVNVVFNNTEGVMDFPLESMFGKSFARNVEWIRIPIVESLGRDLTRRVRKMKKGDSLLYIVDGWDGVKSQQESDLFDKEATKDKEYSDGFGLSKNVYTNKFFRNITDKIYGEDYATKYDYKLDQKDVTIIITSQIRQKIGASQFEKQFYRLGGKAFDFWTHQVIWLYWAGKLKDESKKARGTVYGVKVRAVVERNKVIFPWKEARFPILDGHGIDNVGSMVDYVFGTGQKKSYCFCGEKFGKKASVADYVVNNDLEGELSDLVVEEWRSAEETAKSKAIRKPKYE